jgi:hypothetical protein
LGKGGCQVMRVATWMVFLWSMFGLFACRYPRGACGLERLGLSYRKQREMMPFRVEGT